MSGQICIPHRARPSQPERSDKLEPIATETLDPDAHGYARAVAIWQQGGLVAFPTETVYGLGADATNGTAVARIYAAKGRPRFNPLIIHVADFETARRFGHFSPMAADLAQAFWPGPLSLLVPVIKGTGLSSLVTAGLETVAIRVPSDPLAHALLREFAGAVAAPSANPSGRISPTTSEHVLSALGGRIDAVMAGGKCEIGLESTIVAPDHCPPGLLRPGGLPAEAIERMIGQELALAGTGDAPSSPGQLRVHYAPKAKVTLNVRNAGKNALWLGFGAGCAGAALNLSPVGDLSEAAANLFAYLHELDELADLKGLNEIAVAPVPRHGLGLGINDRLARAASDTA